MNLVPPIRSGRSLDQKLANIHADPHGAKDFILADAKDADMASGLAATGKDPVTGKMRSLNEYRDQMREIVKQGLVDIMLMSASTSDQLTIRETLFENSRITPAVRANDTTDIHLPAGGTYAAEPSRPFRTATIEQIQSGKASPELTERTLGADLGLYSITPNNKLEFDYPTVEAYKQFRIEAEQKGFRHFLEVFDPNACGDSCPTDLGRFINDLIVRTLAGVPRGGRPVFLKIAYHGPQAMEELVAYDPSLVVGVLGGSSGTTYDAFKLLEDAKRHGGRAALFGRKINNSEHQLTFVRFLHAIANAEIGAAEAVKAYHGELEKLKIQPWRALKEDMEATTMVSSYGGSSAGGAAASAKPRLVEAPRSQAAKAGASTPVRVRSVTPAPSAYPKLSSGEIDFKKMTPVQKVAYSRERIRNELTKSNGNGVG